MVRGYRLRRESSGGGVACFGAAYQEASAWPGTIPKQCIFWLAPQFGLARRRATPTLNMAWGLMYENGEGAAKDNSDALTLVPPSPLGRPGRRGRQLGSALSGADTGLIDRPVSRRNG